MFYRPYVPVAERRAKAAKQVRALEKKGKKIEPVEIVHRRKIAGSFWGRAWCEHMESCGDFANRLPRGRTYARNGSVVHLGIESGRMEALVSGSSLYKIAIRVDPLPAKKWEALKKRCRGGIGSLIELLQGKLSDGIMAVVTDRSTGLFPSAKEIHTDCDCPDWADLCKHLAAVLYGVGARLDTAPELLFKLRGVDHAELIAGDAGDLAGTASESKIRRLLDSDALGDVFGVDFEEDDVSVAAEDPVPMRKASRAPDKATTPSPAKKKPAKKKGPATSASREKKAAPAGRAKPHRKDDATRTDSSKAGQETAPHSAFRPTGAAVRSLREDLGMSRAAFAAELGVSPPTVGNWESKKGLLKPRTRSLAALRRLAKTRGAR